MESNRCVGCQWRTPIKMDGRGILCLQKDGKCPDWAVKWALRYGNTSRQAQLWACEQLGEPKRSRWSHTPKPRESMTDEELLETMRL